MQPRALCNVSRANTHTHTHTHTHTLQECGAFAHCLWHCVANTHACTHARTRNLSDVVELLLVAFVMQFTHTYVMQLAIWLPRIEAKTLNKPSTDYVLLAFLLMAFGFTF